MTRKSLARQSVLVVANSRAANSFGVLLVAPLVHGPATLHGVIPLAAGTIVSGQIPPARTFFNAIFVAI